MGVKGVAFLSAGTLETGVMHCSRAVIQCQ